MGYQKLYFENSTYKYYVRKYMQVLKKGLQRTYSAKEWQSDAGWETLAMKANWVTSVPVPKSSSTGCRSRRRQVSTREKASSVRRVGRGDVWNEIKMNRRGAVVSVWTHLSIGVFQTFTAAALWGCFFLFMALTVTVKLLLSLLLRKS